MTEPISSPFSAQAVADYWQSVGATVAALLRLMDSREGWIGEDDEDFFAMLFTFVEQVADDRFASLMERGENASALAEVLAMLGSSRFMRFLVLVDRRQPGFVNRMLLSLSRLGGPAAETWVELFYERLSVTLKSSLLDRIFSSARAARITEDLRMLTGDA